MKQRRSLILHSAFCILHFAFWCGVQHATAGESAAAELLQMSGGARVKIVYSRWVKVKPDAKNDGDSAIYSVFVFDTDEGQERVLVPNSRCKHPLITPNGKRVITDDFGYFLDPDKSVGAGKQIKCYAVDWNGKSQREICPVFKTVGVAEDPPGVEWVYYLDGNNGKVWRNQIDNPAVREIVWDKSGGNWFWAFTRDGKRACAGFPWPNVGVATLPNGAVEPVGGGCGESLCADGIRAFHFISDHAGAMMHDHPGAPGRYITFRTAPGCAGSSVLYPAFSRYDPRMISFTGPQPGTGPDKNPNKPCNVIIGRFDAKYTTVEKWVQVSNSPTMDIGAYCWVQHGADVAVNPTAGLTVKMLDPYVKRLSQASQYKAILDELKKKMDGKEPDEAMEAKQIIAHIENWSKRQLDQAKELEADSLREAEAVYKDVALKLKGMDAGSAAQARLDSVDFKEGQRAWTYVDKMLKAEKGLVEVPGAERSAKDEKFAAKNKMRLDELKANAHLIQQQFPNACVIPAANAILDKYKLDLIGQKSPGTAGVPPASATASNPQSAIANPQSQSPWPSDRSGLLFLWENKNKQMKAFDESGSPISNFALVPRGLVRLDNNYGLWLENGAFTAPNAEKALLAQKGSQFSIEATITPGGAGVPPAGGANAGGTPAVPAEIISFSSKSGDANFFLGQLVDKLVFSLKTTQNRTPQPVELCALTEDTPNHIVLSYGADGVVCYRNGALVTAVNSVTGSFSNWSSDQHLLFGSNWDGQRAWSGRLEGIALYARTLNAKEVQQNDAVYAEKLKSRKSVARLELEGRLKAKTKTPRFAEIAPYTQSLVVYEYDVERVVSGQYKGKTIRVEHWGLMDQKPLPISEMALGKSRKLLLETHADNPQLESEHIANDLSIDGDAAMYYDVGALKK